VKRGQVLVCYAHGGTVSGEFTRTLLDVFMHTTGQVYGQCVEVGGPMISDHRNNLVAKFLEQDAEWMWMVDTDMVFQPDTLRRLLAQAHYKERPIVGALCFGANRTSTNIFPTLYWWKTPEGALSGSMLDLRNSGLVDVDGTGAACLLIHRSVLETLTAEFPPPKGPFEFAWYDTSLGPERIGEDMLFCVRAVNAGFPIFVDCDIRVGHVKPVILDLDYWERWKS